MNMNEANGESGSTFVELAGVELACLLFMAKVDPKHLGAFLPEEFLADHDSITAGFELLKLRSTQPGHLRIEQVDECFSFLCEWAIYPFEIIRLIEVQHGKLSASIILSSPNGLLGISMGDDGMFHISLTSDSLDDVLTRRLCRPALIIIDVYHNHQRSRHVRLLDGRESHQFDPAELQFNSTRDGIRRFIDAVLSCANPMGPVG